jgi:hypothetical protein
MPNSKPLAPALNEVTITIEQKGDKANFHQTVWFDTTKNNTFTHNFPDRPIYEYKIPIQDAGHYPPGFWQFDKKLGQFYELHKTWGKLFDWFKLAEKGSSDIGFLYQEGTPEPVQLEPTVHDFALDNFYLQKNTTVEAAFTDADNKLRGTGNQLGKIAWALIIIFGIVAAVILIYTLTGTPPPVEPVNNATATIAPSLPPYPTMPPRVTP